MTSKPPSEDPSTNHYSNPISSDPEIPFPDQNTQLPVFLNGQKPFKKRVSGDCSMLKSRCFHPEIIISGWKLIKLLQNAFLNRPCIPLVLGLMIGLVLGLHISDHYPPILPWVLGFLLLALPLCILIFPSTAIEIGGVFFLVTGLSLMTFLSPQVNLPQVPPFLIDQSVQHLSGVIIEEPVIYPDKTRFTVRLISYSDQGHDRPTQGIILLGVGGLRKGFNQGDPIRFACRLRLIEGYHNPGGYDFEKRMARKGIRVSGFIEDPGLLILGGPNQRSWLWQRLSLIRGQVSDLIDSKISPPFNGLAQALLTGDQNKIPREIQDTFSQAGVSHLLAFSGLNLTLVGGLSYYVFRFLLGLSETVLLWINIRKWALVGTIFPVLGYTLLAGMSPSAARAFFMVGMVIIALTLNRYSDLLNSLALAALIILLLSPDSLFLPSFQLSFLAVWAIGYLLPRLFNPDSGWSRGETIWTRAIHRGIFYLWATFCVSLVCQLATSPVVAWWFHQISLIGLISNLILVPLSGILATPLGLLALLLAPIFSPLSTLLFEIMNGLLHWTLGLARFFAGLPMAFLIIPRPGFGEIVLFYVTLAFIFNWRRIPKPAFLIPVAGLGMIVFFFSPQIQNFIFPSLRATFLDVGHGNSTLIEFPGGGKMLIDGGGTFNSGFDLGERVVAPFLWARKITALDVVVLTHPHPDHLNGLPYILSKFKVKEVWQGRQEGDTQAYYLLEELIRKKSIKTMYADTREVRIFSDVRVEVLHAPKEKDQNRDALPLAWEKQNNDSLVLRISQNDQNLLFPADIEAEAERELLAEKVPLKSYLLQVPHHGSRTSSTLEFIRAVDPAYAIISGRASPHFPLPHPEVIKRYQDYGVKILRTDQEGAVIVTLNKGEWKIEGYINGLLSTPKNKINPSQSIPCLLGESTTSQPTHHH